MRLRDLTPRFSFRFVPRSLWVGVYVDNQFVYNPKLYICLLPTLCLTVPTDRCRDCNGVLFCNTSTDCHMPF